MFSQHFHICTICICIYLNICICVYAWVCIEVSRYLYTHILIEICLAHFFCTHYGKILNNLKNVCTNDIKQDCTYMF